MKRVIIVFLYLLTGQNSFAQIKKADSLLLVEKAEIGLNFYETSQLDSAKIHFLESISIVKQFEKKYKGNAFLKEQQINAMDYLSSILYSQGNVLEAISYANIVLRYFEEIKDSFNLALSLNNVASIYQSQNMIEKAQEYFARALHILTKLPPEQSDIYVGIIYNNIGLIFERQENYDSTLFYYHKSLDIRKKINDKRGISESLNNIGNTLRKMNRIDEALENLLEALKIKKEIKDANGLTYTLNNISIIYYLKGNMKKSQEYALQSQEFAKKTGNLEALAQIKKSLSKNFFELKNYKEAFLHLKDFIIYNDSLNNINNKKALYKHQIQYEFDKKEALAKAEHEKQLAIEKEAKAKQKIIIFATAGGLGLVAIFLMIVFKRLQVTRRQKKVIEEQKTVVEKAHHELEEKNKEILDSITYAKRIQSAILPPQKLVKEYLQESFILYKPKDIVAGDFYWMEHKNGKILFAAADCTGHGVPGAMVSVICNNGLNRSVREHGLTESGKILDKTREIVIQEFEKSDEEVKDGMDISLCGLDLNNNTLTWSGANNPLWIIRQAGNDENEIIEYKADKQPIGKYAEPKPFTTHHIQLEKGDTIYIFTDGYQDQFGGEKGKKFKAAKLRELFLSIQAESMEKQREIIDQAFETWKGTLEQVDDVCVIGVKI